MTQAPSPLRPGLEGVTAAETVLSRVDGEAGQLLLAGFAVEDLAPEATYEEVLFLFWNGRLPSRPELRQLHGELAAERSLPSEVDEWIARTAGRGLTPADVLEASLGGLRLAGGPREPRRDGLRLVAAFPTLVAAAWRRARGQEPIPPAAELGHAANFLYMLDGSEPSRERSRALDTYLNTVIDHGLNASTFAARVIASTRSDLFSAVLGAVGALKGPLHGGAPGPALDMVFEIGTVERAEAFLRDKLARGERLMGFGHRVYRVRDPRAEVLAAAAERLADSGESRQLYRLARAVEAIALELLTEAKPGRRIETNVEFYTALLLHALGLPQELFTPTFAISRVGGWCAHGLEQLAEGRLIRPRAHYVGPTDRTYVPLEAR